MAGRPTLIRGNSQLFFPGMGRLSENSVVSIKNKSFSVTAEVERPDGGAEGVIIAQGGRFGGWAVYAKDGKAKFVYNVLGIQEFATEADTTDPGRHPPGADGVRLRRRRTGQGRRRHPVLRRHRGRHRPGRSHPADDLLRRRDHRHRLRVRHHRHPRLHRAAAAGSPARSTGCRSTSATTTTTTSSTPTNASASPWPGSKRCPTGSSRIPSSGTHDAPEAEVAGRGVGGLGLASCWPIAKTVIRRAQVRTALDHLRRRSARPLAAQTAHSSAGVAAHSRWADRVPLGLPRRCRQRVCDCFV